MLVDQVEWLQHEVVARGGHVACMEGLQRRAVIDRALRLLGDVVRVRDDGACRDALISLSRSLRLCLSLSRLPPSPSPSPSFLSFSLSLSLCLCLTGCTLHQHTGSCSPYLRTDHPPLLRDDTHHIHIEIAGGDGTVVAANIQHAETQKNAVVLALYRNKLLYLFAAEAVVAIAFVTALREATSGTSGQGNSHEAAQRHREELFQWSSSKAGMERRFDLTVAGVTAREYGPGAPGASLGAVLNGASFGGGVTSDSNGSAPNASAPNASAPNGVERAAVLNGALSVWTLLARELVHVPASFAEGRGAEPRRGGAADEDFPWIDRSELPILEAALERMCGKGGVLAMTTAEGRKGEAISLAAGGAEQLLFLASLVWPLIDTYWVALVACKEMRPADIEAAFAAQQRRAAKAKAKAQGGTRGTVSVAAAPTAAAKAEVKAPPLKTRLLRRAERLYHASALEHFESCSNETFDQAVSRLTEVDVLAKQKLRGEKVVAPAYVEEGRLARLAAEVFRFRLLPSPAAAPTEPTPAKL